MEKFWKVKRANTSAICTARTIAPSPNLGEGWGEVKKSAFTLAEVFSPHCASYRKIAFTLAEVLITLGIIGVVAALTIPTLIAKHQKHVWYTQFRKAASVLENAINMYNNDHGCGEKVKHCDSPGNCYENYNDLCALDEGIDAPLADRLSEYMNVVQWINEDNYEDICAGYEKLPPASDYDGTGRDDDPMYLCKDDRGGVNYDKGYAFITNDGMLFNLATDDGLGGGRVVDINGPKGPNIYGRDIFVFYLFIPPSERWGSKEEGLGCSDDNKVGYNCGIRLLQEGKMNY